MRAITMSPAKRVATAAIAAVLLGGTPGLASAATPQAAQPAAQPSQQTENWYQLRIWPTPSSSGVNLEAGNHGRAIVANPQKNNDHQLWGLSGMAGKQLVENKATGTCLTAPNRGQGVTLRTCDKNDLYQQWTVEYTSQGRVAIVPTYDRDLALTGSAGLGTEVFLRVYSESANQQWSAVPPGA
ncbi:RICIN domain-containing protein [Kitasatospora sp. NPDC002543]